MSKSKWSKVGELKKSKAGKLVLHLNVAPTDCDGKHRLDLSSVKTDESTKADV